VASKYTKLTPAERAAAYAKRDAGGVASKLAKEKRIKELIDSFIETGDYENFKTQLASSQKKFRLPSGQLRGATAGGRVPPTLLKEITEAFKAGPDSAKFKELVRISGRDASELIEFSEKIPVKGTIDAKTRAIKAKESFPEWRKKTEAEKAATQAKAQLKRTGNLAYSKAALGSKDFSFLEILNKKKAEINNFFKNDPKRLFNTDFGKNTKDLIDARFKDGKITFDRRANSYYQKLIDKGIYSEFDISPVRIKKKSLRYPINLNVAPSQFNSAFIEQVDRYFRKNNNPSALNEVSEFLKSKNLRLNIPDVATIGAEADVAFVPETGKTPRIDKTLQILGYEGDGLEKIKEIYKSEPGNSVFRKGMDDIIKCADGCFIKVANKNPEKVLDTLKKEPQKLIRLFRGESMFKPKDLGYTGDKIIPPSARGRWFSKSPEVAGMFAEYPGIIKKVDVTPTEFAKGKKIQTRSKLGSYVDPNELVLPKSKMADVGIDIPRTIGYNLKWDNIKGAFVNSGTDDVVSQAELKTWAADNPMPVKAGTEDAFKPIKKSMLKTIGKSLAYVGAPLPTAVIDSYFIGKQIADDRPAENIAKDPLNWLGLATMSTLSDISGVSKAGKLNTALRLGMSPGLIRGASRFLGLPGLAISTALTAYDQYEKYKNEEGLIYNLFNNKARPV